MRAGCRLAALRGQKTSLRNPFITRSLREIGFVWFPLAADETSAGRPLLKIASVSRPATQILPADSTEGSSSGHRHKPAAGLPALPGQNQSPQPFYSKRLAENWLGSVFFRGERYVSPRPPTFRIANVSSVFGAGQTPHLTTKAAAHRRSAAPPVSSHTLEVQAV